jgi:ribonuclease E
VVEGDTENGAARAPRARRSRDRYGRDRRERGPREASAPAADDATPADTAAFVANDRSDAPADEAPARSSYFTQPATTPTAPRAAAAELAAAVDHEALAEVVKAVEAAPAVAVPAPAPVTSVAPVAPLMAAPVAPAPVAPRAAAPTPAPSAPAATGLPKVQPFVLPIETMNQVAQSSGLEWVNSNPEKVAQVQAAIAAEPKPVHVPREIPPVVVIDEGPLVLVETRKDLRDVQLPFEVR